MSATPDPSVPDANDISAAAEATQIASESSQVVPGPAQTQPQTQSRLDQLRKRIELDKLDGEAWLALIEDYQGRGEVEAARDLYEEFFKVWPNAGRQWLSYATMYLDLAQFPTVEAIFARCLPHTPYLPLWRLYILYVRRVNPTQGSGPQAAEARNTVAKAYDHVLANVGGDKDAGDIWREYADFLKESEPRGTWEQQQQMDALRRLYQRAVCLPLNNVEQIWREYDAFENGLSRITAKKFLAERSPAYMTARGALRELRQLADRLYRPLLPRPPAKPSWTAKEKEAVEDWKKYLKWEESNPLDLEDQQALASRIEWAYHVATMHVRFFPEVWYMGAQALFRLSRADAAIALLRGGIEACPSSTLLGFALVDFLESRAASMGSPLATILPEVSSVFERLVGAIHEGVEHIQRSIEEEVGSIDAEAAAEAAKVAEAEEAKKNKDGIVSTAAGGEEELMTGEEREEERKKVERREEKKAEVRQRRQVEVDEEKKAGAMVWIAWIRFVRRAEGIKPARAIFGKARKSPHCTWHVYDASAMMEYHCSKDQTIATKVYELGLNNVGKGDSQFVVRYLDFLININDDNNARALFERTIGTFTPEQARLVWERWSEYEFHFGDATAARRLEDRLAEAYPEEPHIDRFTDRHSYLDLDPISTRDRGLDQSHSDDSFVEPARYGQANEDEHRKTPRNGQAQKVSKDADSEGEADRAQAEPAAKRRKADRRSTPSPERGGGFDRTRKRGSSPAVGGGGGSGRPEASKAPEERNAYGDIPEAVVFFMSLLPTASSFDGPTFKPEDLMETFRQSSLPTPTAPPGRGGRAFSLANFGGGGPTGRGRFDGASPPRGRRRGRGRGRFY